MSAFATVGMRRAAALGGILLVAGACDLGPDPDPRVLASMDGYVPPQAEDRAVLPATGDFADGSTRAQAGFVPAAPLGEPLLERRKLQPEVLRIAVGRDARELCDERVLAAFDRTLPDVRTESELHTDRQAIDLVMTGRAELALIGGQLSPREQQAGLQDELIGVELFALAVPIDSPLRSLNRDQVRRVFTGQASVWRDLGLEGSTIVPVVPADTDLARRAARVLMPGDRFAASCTHVADERQVADLLQQHAGAIAVVRLTAQAPLGGQRLLMIDWVEPTAHAFASGSYPFGVPLHAVTGARPLPAARGFADFAASPLGRRLLGDGVVFVR